MNGVSIGVTRRGGTEQSWEIERLFLGERLTGGAEGEEFSKRLNSNDTEGTSRTTFQERGFQCIEAREV